MIKGNLKTGNGKESTQESYVMENFKEPLLGPPAIDALNLVRKVDTIHSDDSTRIEQKVKTMYPNLFKHLGELEGQFSIKLSPGSTPHAITTPRRVALPLMPKVKEELQRMEKLGVISKVDIPTDWCAGMVVVPKPDGRIRICVDLTKLNESVLARHTLYQRLTTCWPKSVNRSSSPSWTATLDSGKKSLIQIPAC